MIKMIIIVILVLSIVFGFFNVVTACNIIEESEFRMKPVTTVLKRGFEDLFERTTLFGKITGILFILLMIPGIILAYIMSGILKLLRWLSDKRHF